MSVIDRSSIETHNSSESLKVGSGSSSSDLSTESVTSDSGHGNLLLVHEPDDVLREVVHVVRSMVVRVALVSVVQEPHVSDIGDLVRVLSEERLEGSSVLDVVGKPNESWHVLSLGSDELTS